MPDLKVLLYLTGGTHWIGGVQYTRNLVRALSRLPSRECPLICLQTGAGPESAACEQEFGSLPNIQIDRPLHPAEKRGAALRLADTCTVAFPVKGPVDDPYRINLYWVPDFQYKHYPEFFPAEERARRDHTYHEMFRQAKFLVLSSHAVVADFRRFFPEHRGVRVRVMSFASLMDAHELGADCSQLCASYGLPDRFAYVPNQIWQHKGHDTVLAALVSLRKRGIVIPVVWTGNTADYRSASYFRTLEETIAQHCMQDQVKILGLIPRFDQIQILRQAALIVQPSRFEGWSTVVEDARALGKPIVLSDLAVHKEQAPPLGHYFKVGDPCSLEAVLARHWPKLPAGPSLLQDPAARQADRRVQAFARRFLAIAAEAHQMHPAVAGRRRTVRAVLRSWFAKLAG